MNDLFDLSGRVALVTGGAGGLGRPISRALAEHGAKVAIADVQAERLAEAQAEMEAAGFGIGTYEVDLTDAVAMRTMVDAMVADHGAIDILINAVGITYNSTALDFPEKQYDRIMAVNLKGPYLLCQKVGRLMIERGYGRIVNIASIGGLVSHHPRSSVYGISKAGITQLTKALGHEWATTGVTVNAIAPGYFRTPMTIPHFADPGFFRDNVQAKTPMGRPGEPPELLGAVLLLSSEAASYMTGTTISVDGGWSAT